MDNRNLRYEQSRANIFTYSVHLAKYLYQARYKGWHAESDSAAKSALMCGSKQNGPLAHRSHHTTRYSVSDALKRRSFVAVPFVMTIMVGSTAMCECKQI